MALSPEYRHQATSWLLRMRSQAMTGEQQESEIARMADLVEKVDDPRLWVQHYRDAAAYAFLLRNDSASSSQAHGRYEPSPKSTVKPIYGCDTASAENRAFVRNRSR